MDNSKGFSSVIGTTFMVLVMLFLGTSVFLWTLSQNTFYNEAVRTRNQEEADRINEGVIALSGNYSVSEDEDSVTVIAVLKNTGSVTAQLVNLWVLDTNQSKYAYNPLNLNLNPGDIEPVAYTVTIADTNANNTFASWFVTARGNTVPLEREMEEGVIVAEVAQGIGSMAMEFYTFRYFSVSDDKLEGYPTGISAFNVATGQDLAFGVVLTNFDPSKKTIVLDSHSQLWLYSPKSASAVQWYIANVNGDGTINSTYSEISIAWRETKLLIFASKYDDKFSSMSIPGGWKSELCAVNLLLHGTLGVGQYGQNIPFVSLYCQ